MKICYLMVWFCFINNHKLLRADIPSGKLTEVLELYAEENHVFSHPAQCDQILNEFADYASNFTKCSIQFARPIRLCQNCIEQYVNFRDKYQELTDAVVNGTSCKSVFISQDRLDVILDYYNNILAVWYKGNCNACYDWSKGTPILSNETIRFNKMYNETIKCINNTHNIYKNNSEKICEKCMQSYFQINDYYNSLSDDSVGLDDICMDIVDSMNATRYIWSKTLNCCKLRRSPEIIFLCCTGIISILPLVYYLVVRFCGPIRDLPNVLKQSRFKQSFLRSVNGRIN